VIRARVFATLPEFSQVRIEGPDEWQYVFNRSTPGIDFRDLREGDMVECEVTTHEPRQVLRAKRLGDL
jgi:hypothetical protein